MKMEMVSLSLPHTPIPLSLSCLQDGRSRLTSPEPPLVTLKKTNHLITLGELDFQEILNAATHRKLIAKEDRIRNLFERLDENHDGSISVQEIHHALGSSPTNERTNERTDLTLYLSIYLSI